MALDLSILEAKAPAPMAMKTEKELRDSCPHAKYVMRVDPETGIHVVSRTGLAPMYFLRSAGPYNAGEVYGLLPVHAKVNLANGNAMEILGIADVLEGSEKPARAKKAEKEPAPATA